MTIMRQITKTYSLQNGQTRRVFIDGAIHKVVYSLLAAALLAALSVSAESQTLVAVSAKLPSREINAISEHINHPYTRPTQRIMISNYGFDIIDPHPVAGALFTAGINQFGNSLPEWNQGVRGYSKRYGSNYRIAAIGTTTRYALAESFKKDTLYYRCECSGVLPRLRHAAISTLTGRKGKDGHRVFSVPVLVAPYAGSMIAVYGWYTNRYGEKDTFRIGNYSMLVSMGENISLVFFYKGPHSLLSHMHLNNAHGSTVEGPSE